MPRPLPRPLGFGELVPQGVLGLAAVGFAAGVAICLGMLAAAAPPVALGAAAAGVLAALLLVDLTVGLAVFMVVDLVLVPWLTPDLANASKAAGALVILAWLASWSGRPSARGNGLAHHQPALVAAFVLFLAWGAASALWAIDRSAVVGALGRYAPNMLLVAIVVAACRGRREVRWLVAALAAAAALAAIAAVAAGFEEERLGGPFRDANQLAAVLVPGVVLSAALAGTERSGRRWLFAGLAVLCAGVLFATLSRGGLVALAIALIVWTMFGGRWRSRLLLVSLTIVALAVGYFGLFSTPAARERVSSFTAESPLSSGGGSGRSDIWKVGWRVVAANPATGVGLDNFTTASPRYLLQPGLVRRSDLIIVTPKEAHNTYLQVLAEAGVVGAALFLPILLLPLRAMGRAARAYASAADGRMELLARAVFAATIGVLAADLFISGQYQRQLWLLLGIGVAMLAVAPASDDREDARRLPRHGQGRGRPPSAPAAGTGIPTVPRPRPARRRG